MDKRKAWREQEQQLVEKWNSAAQRYRDIMAQIAREDPFATPGGPERGNHEQGSGGTRRDRRPAEEGGAPEGGVQLGKAILTMRLVRPGRSAAWTRERIDLLTTPEIRQLRDNAERLSESEIVGLCEEILKVRPKTGTGLKAVKTAVKAKRPAAA